MILNFRRIYIIFMAIILLVIVAQTGTGINPIHSICILNSDTEQYLNFHIQLGYQKKKTGIHTFCINILIYVAVLFI